VSAATRLRVAIDARALQPGFREHAGRGIGRYAVELVRAMARRDDVALELWVDPALPAPHLSGTPGATLRRYPPLKAPKAERLATTLTVPFAASRSGADVFHFLSHGDAPPFMPACGIVTVHDLILEVLGSLYGTSRSLPYRIARASEAMALKGARMLIADSAVTRDDLVRLHGVRPDRVRVVHLGVDSTFRPPGEAAVAALRARLQLERPFVLYVGGIDARKNVTLLVRAFALARPSLPAGCELVLAGRIDGAPEYRPLRVLVASHGLGAAFRTLGFVASSDLPALLAAAGVFAFPSLYEGFGLPPLEAMACGAPVVSTRGGSLGEVLGDAARFAPADDPRAFADGLVAVLGDPGLRADLRARGLAHAARFTWDRTAEETVHAYRAAVAARGVKRTGPVPETIP
jgi:glycosyltransferase involved in cell wall biosynthesis